MFARLKAENERLRVALGITPQELRLSVLEHENNAIREAMSPEKRLSILERENKALLKTETKEEREERLARLEAENRQLREQVEARRKRSENSEEK